MKIISILLLAWLFLIFGCAKNNEEKLFPKDNSTTCDTTSVSFSKDVLPVFQSNCSSCHSGSQPINGMDLSSYDGAVKVANGGRLLGAINQQSGYSAMPKDGKLSTCNINKITAWINKGKPNN